MSLSPFYSWENQGTENRRRFLNLSVLGEPRLRSLPWPPGLPLPGWGLSGDSEKVWKHRPRTPSLPGQRPEDAGSRKKDVGGFGLEKRRPRGAWS